MASAPLTWIEPGASATLIWHGAAAPRPGGGHLYSVSGPALEQRRLVVRDHVLLLVQQRAARDPAAPEEGAEVGEPDLPAIEPACEVAVFLGGVDEVG